jgi:TonB family protein
MPAASSNRRANLLVRNLAALACAWACVIGCAARAPSDATWLESAPHDAGASEDAAPRYYAPDEVDAVARLVTPIDPPYPRSLRARNVEGDVVARVLVRSDGSVAGAKLLQTTDEAFADAARSQIRGARFAPALLRGEPVPSWVIVRIRFRLA